MGFEQNQQDQFNMNNSLDQVKQFQANLDKATTSIGAAELAAEEELLAEKYKNLAKVQQARVTHRPSRGQICAHTHLPLLSEGCSSSKCANEM